MRLSYKLLERQSRHRALTTLQRLANRQQPQSLQEWTAFRACSTLVSSSKSTSSQQQHFTGGPFSWTTAPQVRFQSSSSSSAVQEKEDQDEKAPAATTSGKPWLLDLGIPSLVPEWKRMFAKESLLMDVSAGLTVGCVAVPLSLAIALASGVPAEVGLVTAAVSGVAGGLLGGTTLAVTGPAAAISLLVVGAITEHGLEALPFITLASGGLQLISGVTRLGVVAKLVPVSVIAGFTTGIGTLILTGQLPKALGMATPVGLNPVELLGYIGSNVSAISPAAAGLAIGTSAAMYYLPKVHAKMPSALLAVGGATVATQTLGLDVATIGAIPSGLEAFQMAVPTMPPVESWGSLMGTVLLIYGMTSAETLLSCAALEKMKKTPYRHCPDQELIGQGVANVGASMFMGMPVTSVIARSSLNVRLNAETRLPAIVQSGFVFSSVVFMSSTISMVPMPALSGVLMTTGMGMLNPTELKHCTAVQKTDFVPFATTFAGMLSLGLAEGIGIGIATAAALNYNKAKLQVTEGLVNSETDDDTVLYQLQGPLNFNGMFTIDNMIKRMDELQQDRIVVDVQDVTTVEFTGVEELVNRLREFPVPIEMINCNEEMRSALDLCDPKEQIVRN